MVKRRVFISAPADDNLDDQRRALVHAVIEQVVHEGFEPQRFLYSGLPASMGWNFQTVDEVMRRCVGAVVLAFPRWSVPDSSQEHGGPFALPTEYNHYEGAVANTLGLPLLIVADRSVADRGIAWKGGGLPIVFAPNGAAPDWLKSDPFRHRFSLWLDQVKGRQDVFLGYCSQAKETASCLYVFLRKLDVKVLDWADFSGGGSILDEVERAASVCSAGIFLFTRDDLLEDSSGDRATPRDNVLFEAGYFMQSKKRERVLIIRELGAKMPADIGGNIYLSLTDRHDVSSIETQLRTFIETRL